MMARKLKYGGNKYKEKVFIKRGPLKGVSRPGGYFDSSTLKQGVDIQVKNVQGLRITGGDRRNSKIVTPAAYMRPMMSRVREAFFSMVRTTDVTRPSASCIDFFSGAGTCGFEALSRGIGHATMVDFSETCTSVIQDNADHLDFEDRTKIVQARVEDVLRNPEAYGIMKPFDLVMLTPPYEEVVYSELMTAVARSSIVAPNTIVMVEYPVELGSLPQVMSNGNLVGYRNRRYGRTVLAIYVYRPSGSPFDEFEQHPEEFIEQNWK
jgi:16S rRNA (guanine(966)-N(2))-methyltransferase RsmD